MVEYVTLRIAETDRQVRCGPDSLVGRELIPAKTLDRFSNKIRITESGDWEWLGSLNHDGYGGFRIGRGIDGVDRGSHNAHHAAYLLFVGPVPKGYDVDHLCHRSTCRLGKLCPHRACVRPSHLETKTRGANLQRGSNRWWQADTCAKGHPWTPESTIERDDGRTCRICRKERARAAYAKKIEGVEKLPHHNAVKTHCPKGHEYTPENTIIRPNGTRACRTCGREATLRWYHAGRGAGKVAHKDKTHCPQGHEYTPENTYLPPSGIGRACRICKAEASRRQAEKRKKKLREI